MATAIDDDLKGWTDERILQSGDALAASAEKAQSNGQGQPELLTPEESMHFQNLTSLLDYGANLLCRKRSKYRPTRGNINFSSLKEPKNEDEVDRNITALKEAVTDLTVHEQDDEDKKYSVLDLWNNRELQGRLQGNLLRGMLVPLRDATVAWWEAARVLQTIDDVLKEGWTPKGKLHWGDEMIRNAEDSIQFLLDQSNGPNKSEGPTDTESMHFYSAFQNLTSLLDYSAKLLCRKREQYTPASDRIYFRSLNVPADGDDVDTEILTLKNAVTDLTVQERRDPDEKAYPPIQKYSVLDLWNSVKHNGMPVLLSRYYSKEAEKEYFFPSRLEPRLLRGMLRPLRDTTVEWWDAVKKYVV